MPSWRLQIVVRVGWYAKAYDYLAQQLPVDRVVRVLLQNLRSMKHTYNNKGICLSVVRALAIGAR